MNKLLLITLLLCQFSLFAQEDAWVYLADKENVASSIANPISILTQKAIDRKDAHGVSIDDRDVPVNESYISQLKNATGITVLAKSKWFNAVHVRGTQTDITNLTTTFSFIDHIDFANKTLNTSKLPVYTKKESKFKTTLVDFEYGNAANQIEMINGDYLHAQNYTGTGMSVAVIDAGFPNVHTMSAFQRLRNAGNLLGSYNFLTRDADVFVGVLSNHGTLVLSTMAGYVENEYVGTAPDASYYLFVTEDVANENPVEESYWVEAAERADSLGVDVINTSLGYTTFDNSDYNYTNADMDGNTAFITRGANIAFEKGMLLVNSAGNSGNAIWQIVGAPADAPGVLSIGAVNPLGVKASFSSIGSNAQPTQKPDVVAQGSGSAVIYQNDVIGTSNGTSFSSPIMAGGVVCLWQALPDKTNAEIMQLIRESASQYSTPDYLLGYGIPNLETALNNGLPLNIKDDTIQNLNVSPNPTSDRFTVTVPSGQSVDMNIYDGVGKLIMQTHLRDPFSEVNITSLSSGLYIVKLQNSETTKTVKLIKR